MRTLEAPHDGLAGTANATHRPGSASPELRRSLGISDAACSWSHAAWVPGVRFGNA